MKITMILAIPVLPIALGAIAPAVAQESATGMQAVDPDPIQLGPGPQAKPVPKVRRPARANRDARHCLELTTTREIIKCAEKYL